MRSISKKLDNRLKEDFISVNKAKNPVFGNLHNLSFNQKVNAICQYSVFPRNIVSFLIAATYSMSYHNWKDVVEELLQNVNEEMGKGEGDIEDYNLPHYTILRKVFEEGFKIDIVDVLPNPSTNSFLTGIKALLEDKRPEFVCGAIYALESSAVPELTLVKDLVVSAANDHKLKIPKLLLDFFDYHIDEIEVGHRERFMEMTAKYISDEKSWELFEEGFEKTMFCMDTWWVNLKSEI